MKKSKLITLLLCVVLIMSLIGCGGTTEPSTTDEGDNGAQSDDKLVFALVPKSTGAQYFISCEQGAKIASDELGVDYIWTGPTSEDSARQITMIEDLITQGVDALIISPVDAEACVDVINRAMEKGIPTFTWDMDSENSNRLFCVTGMEANESGYALAEGCAEEIGYKGEVAILTGSLGSDVLNRRIAAIEECLAQYPDIKIVAIEATDEDMQKGISVSENLLQAYPNLAGFIGVSAGNPIMAGTAIKNAGRDGIAVWSVGLPSTGRDFVKDGTVKGMMLLDPGAMTYVAMAAAKQYIEDGSLPVDGQNYGNYAGTVVVNGSIAFVPTLLFTKDNIDNFGF